VGKLANMSVIAYNCHKMTEVDMERIGQTLRSRREQLGWSLRQVSERVAQMASGATLSHTHISDIEQGKLSPTLDKLSLHASAVGMTLVELLDGTAPALNAELVVVHDHLLAIMGLDREEFEIVNQQLAIRRAKLERATSQNGKTRIKKRAWRNMQSEADDGGLPEVVGYSSGNKDASTFQHADERVEQLVREVFPPGVDPTRFIPLIEEMVEMGPIAARSFIGKLRKLAEGVEDLKGTGDNDQVAEDKKEHPA
jgi:transcriptional regulator with XRE-family HTH domain